jgi:hypothetical protein
MQSLMSVHKRRRYMEDWDGGSEENTVNPRYNDLGCTGQNMAVRNCEFLEILQLEGFVVRKLWNKNQLQYKNH